MRGGSGLARDSDSALILRIAALYAGMRQALLPPLPISDTVLLPSPPKAYLFTHSGLNTQPAFLRLAVAVCFFLAA